MPKYSFQVDKTPAVFTTRRTYACYQWPAWLGAVGTHSWLQPVAHDATPPLNRPQSVLHVDGCMQMCLGGHSSISLTHSLPLLKSLSHPSANQCHLVLWPLVKGSQMKLDVASCIYSSYLLDYICGEEAACASSIITHGLRRFTLLLRECQRRKSLWT